MAGKISVGTASWTDPGFIAEWYPRDLAAADRLTYYAEHFNLVEVNSSFYAVPIQRVVQRWCEQTPGGFVFDVKLHRLLSRHSTKLSMLPPALRSLAEMSGERVKVTPALEKALTQEFLRQIAPLIETGKLGALLLQLTPAFSPQQHQLDELDGLLELLREHEVAVELRNRHWVRGDQSDRTAAYFRERQVTLVAVDAPKGEHFMTMPDLDAVTAPKLSYLRLHGRNLKGYVTGRSVAERFDYLYSNEELAEIAKRAVRLAEQTARTHVIYNNNAHDYPLRNAATFQQMLLRSYPETISLSSGASAPTPSTQVLELDLGLPPAAPGRRR